MVFLRLEVKVFIAEQVDQSRILPSVFQDDFGDDGSQTSCSAAFLLMLNNPEQLSMGDLAHLIKEKWNTLRPNCEPLIIKKLLDDAMPLIDLELGMSVADAFVDYGKAHADGYDQRAAVRVIHTSDNYCSGERFPSLIQDFEGAAEAYAQRKAEKLFTRASSPTPRESHSVSIRSMEAPVPNYEIAAHPHIINSPQLSHTVNTRTARSQDENASESRKRKRTKSRDHTPAKAPRLEVQPKESPINQPLSQVSVSSTGAKPESKTSRCYTSSSKAGKKHQPPTPSNSQTRDPLNNQASQPVQGPKFTAKPPKARRFPHIPEAEQIWLIRKAKAMLADSTTNATLVQMSKAILTLSCRLNETSNLTSEVESHRREAQRSALAHRLSQLQKILESAKKEPAMPVEAKNTKGNLHQGVDKDPEPTSKQQVMIRVEVPPETDTYIKKEAPEEESIGNSMGKKGQEAIALEPMVFSGKEWLQNDFIPDLTHRTDVCGSEFEQLGGTESIDQPKKESNEHVLLATDEMAPPIHPSSQPLDEFALQEVLALMRRTQNIPWPN
ncbi:uncharacterized protein N7483_008164 [Penicillium malachiteum]|uniref:uncharacterized protein n=1 Tax=Penicillium malachiteum TaxID=1324776 RepID=UPI00254694AF|nr:uncharacterized protein N7483_008164 [Penicillium malachiteum]KAJ5720230.1 hypothetical protein N7483_008164 [Penicillium malachiteum]